MAKININNNRLILFRGAVSAESKKPEAAANIVLEVNKVLYVNKAPAYTRI